MRNTQGIPTIEENRLHDAILDAFYRLEEDKAEVLTTARESIEYALNRGQSADDSADLQGRIKDLQAEMMGLIKSGVKPDTEQHDDKFKTLSDEIAFYRHNCKTAIKAMLTSRIIDPGWMKCSIFWNGSRQLIPVGDGFGLLLYFNYDFFSNGKKQCPESKPRGARNKKKAV